MHSSGGNSGGTRGSESGIVLFFIGKVDTKQVAATNIDVFYNSEVPYSVIVLGILSLDVYIYSDHLIRCRSQVPYVTWIISSRAYHRVSHNTESRISPSRALAHHPITKGNTILNLDLSATKHRFRS